MEIYGTEGTLSVPDPNTFGGPVRLRQAGSNAWDDVPLTHGYTKNSRGLGVADMAYAMQDNRPHRANGQMAYHVLEIMHAIHRASEQGQHIELTSSCQQPMPLSPGEPEPEPTA
jgi:predicted dehydrogenase